MGLRSKLRNSSHGAPLAGFDYVLTVRRLGPTLPASTCASERADIAAARP
jgi:hypothetical protein